MSNPRFGALSPEVLPVVKLISYQMVDFGLFMWGCLSGTPKGRLRQLQLVGVLKGRWLRRLLDIHNFILILSDHFAEGKKI